MKINPKSKYVSVCCVYVCVDGGISESPGELLTVELNVLYTSSNVHP